MPETTVTENMTAVETSPPPKVADMAPLIIRMREFLARRPQNTKRTATPYDLNSLTAKFGFAPRKKGRPEVILAEDVAVELGHPATASQAIILISFQAGLIRPGEISIVGPDLDAIGAAERHPFAQVVMLQVNAAQVPDPFELENTQYLMHRLPGYMVRSVPGKLWVRISKNGKASGLTLKTVGSALLAAYTHDFQGVVGAEVVFVTSAKGDVEELSQIATEADILAGRHKKLVLGIDGDIECRELNCETCEEKPVCDNLRDIVIKRRKRKNV